MSNASEPSNSPDPTDHAGPDGTVGDQDGAQGWVVSPHYTGPDRRSSAGNRRSVVDRRHETRSALEKAQALLEAEELAEEMAELAPSQDDETGLERRRGPGRRRSDFTKAAEEGEMTPEQFLFVMAIEAFKQANDKIFPSWTDVLEVIRLLGYRKTCSSELNLRNAEDWTERPDAGSGVREGATHLLRARESSKKSAA